MKFQGDIASIPITDVAQNLSANRKAGTLTIRYGSQLRRIAFQDGKIFSYTDNLGFSVTRWLGEKGIVDPEVLRKAVGKARKSSKKHLGMILEEAGALPAGDYAEHVRAVVEDSLYETFTLRSGTFEFHENEFPADALEPDMANSGLEFAVGSILIEAARRFDDWEALRSSMPPEGDFWEVPPKDRERRLAELKEAPLARATLELLDGSRSIGEVVALLPAGRFEASKAVADLVAKRWIRPVEAGEILGNLDLRTPKGKERTLVRLKAAREREPGNRELLRRIADLALELDRKEECASALKLLAQGLQDDKDLRGAEESLHRALRLNQLDLGTWQKLYDVIAARGDTKAHYSFGVAMARHLRKLGLEEMARDHLARMTASFSDRPELILEHAASLFSLGERAKAVEELLDLARDLIKKEAEDEAEHVLARVLEYDREHRRASELISKIRTGKLARERLRRRRFQRSAVACLIVACLGLFLGYDIYVRREFVLATRQVFAEGLIEKGQYGRAADRLESVARSHRISLLGLLEGREILRALREAEARKWQELRDAPGGLVPAGQPQGPSGK